MRQLPPGFAAIPTPVFAWERRAGGDFELVGWNPAAERQTAGNVARLLGKRANEIYAGQPEVLAALRATTPDAAPRAGAIEYTMLTTGEGRSFNVAYIPVGADLVLVATEDLTESRRAQLALEESERRYRTLVEGAPDGIVVHRNGVILYVNEAFARTMRAPPASFVGTRVMSLVHPDDREYVLRRVRDIELGATAPLVEERLLRADGSVVYGEITGIPTTFDSAPAVQAIVRDVSERHRAEALFVALSEQSLTGVIVLQDGKVRYANPRAVELFGYGSAGEMMGLSHEALIAPSSLEYAQQMMRDRLERKKGTVHYTCTALRRGAGEFEAEVFGSVIDLDGRPALVGTILDASERERMAAQLRQAQKMDAVGRLAGGIAHDFNNILTAIMSYADLVLDEVPATSPVHADVTEIRSAGERLAALTRQLVAFSRQQALEPTVTDVNDVVQGITKMLQRLIEAPIALVVEPGPDVPKVMADRAQLEQVLLNLAVNARDSMVDNGQLMIRSDRHEVNVAEAAANPGLSAGTYARIQVTDSGPGIPPDILPRIFEPFFTTKAPGKGTGLGLSVVYGIVKQSGGYIMVDSPAGAGATFSVLLPALSARGGG